MAFHVRDPETDRIVRALAAQEGKTLTEAIRDACEARLLADPGVSDGRSLAERIKPIQDRLAAFPETGKLADKAFFDAMSGHD